MSSYKHKLPPLFDERIGYDFRSSIKSARPTSQRTDNEYLFSSSPRIYEDPKAISLDERKKLSGKIDISKNPEDNKLLLLAQFNVKRNVLSIFVFL
jgi:hypothetical protein